MVNEATAHELETIQRALDDAQLSLLGEQLLILQRIERSMEMLVNYSYSQLIQPEATPTPSSVEIGRNAKHEPVWTVKVYCAVGEEQQALERALALEKRLQDEYGMAGLP
jgi:hypothetical protein